MDRITYEQAFHDRQSRERAAAGVNLTTNDGDYLDHETWIRPAFKQLGDVRGLRVLDYGCGHGMAAVVMARAGAQVTAFDLSAGYVEEAKARARANGVAISFVHANAEQLPFAANSFDRVWGCAILHHLDLHQAALGIRRVLRPEGRAVFCEPWGGNPLLNFARRRLNFVGKHRTIDEKPLVRADVKLLRRFFPCIQVQGFQLAAMAHRVAPSARLRRPLDWCDAMLLELIPALRQFCRYVVLTLHASE